MNKIFLLLLCCILVGCNLNKSTNQSDNSHPPNIIYILADDLGYGDLSFTGQMHFQTNNIDQLADEGMFFTQHYSGSTVCAPSRSTLMTGKHTGHTFIRGNRAIKPEGQYPLDSSVITVAELLKGKGYVTGAFGKWGLGFPGSEGDPNFQGFDEFFGYNCQSLAHKYYPDYLWYNQDQIYLDGNTGNKTETYAPIAIHEKAMAFLEKNKDNSFFLYYPTTIPHAELIAPEKYMKKFRGKLLPEKNYRSKVWDGDHYEKSRNYSSQKEAHAAFAAMVYLLDEQVGEIVQKLKELGIAENTVIIFTSDNGPHLEGGADPEYFNSNAQFRGYKRDLYEGGIRTSMIAWWPGKIEPGATSNHISAFWDFLPTACEIAGVDVPRNIDGLSFLPELLGKKQKKHDHLYWEFHERGGKQAVRWGDWKGVRLNMDEAPEAPIELYNLKDDIGEEHNIADDYPEIVKKIAEIMKNEHTTSDVFQFGFEKE